MKILDVVCSKGRTGFYFDDQRAIKKGAAHDGVFYQGAPVTEGFTSVRMPGESISVQIILEDGQVAYGDCAAVQYSGAGGRDPLFLAKDFIPVIDKYIKPMLVGKEADNFRQLAAEMEAIQVEGKRLHTAIRYGVSQAILDAVAKAKHMMMCEVVAEEYGCEVSDKPIDIFTQSGDDRYDNSDKMIIKQAQVLPHALINNVETKLGPQGELLEKYVAWLRDRILNNRADENYNPIFHIDVYGTIGAAFGNTNFKAMADYLEKLAETAKPFHLRIEGPMDCDVDRETQMLALKGLTEEIDRRGIDVELVADEWCNTLEDIRDFRTELPLRVRTETIKLPQALPMSEEEAKRRIAEFKAANGPDAAPDANCQVALEVLKEYALPPKPVKEFEQEVDAVHARIGDFLAELRAKTRTQTVGDALPKEKDCRI